MRSQESAILKSCASGAAFFNHWKRATQTARKRLSRLLRASQRLPEGEFSLPKQYLDRNNGGRITGTLLCDPLSIEEDMNSRAGKAKRKNASDAPTRKPHGHYNVACDYVTVKYPGPNTVRDSGGVMKNPLNVAAAIVSWCLGDMSLRQEIGRAHV